MNKHLLILLCGLFLGLGCNTPPPASFDENPQLLQNPTFTRQWATSLAHGDYDPVTAIYLSDQYVFAYRQGGSSSVMDRATGRLLHIDHPKDGVIRLHPPVVLKDRIVYPTTTYLEVFDADGRYIEHPTKATDEIDKPFSQSMEYPIRSDAVGLGKQVFFGADYAGSGRAIGVDMTHPYVPEIWTLMEPGSGVTAAPAVLKDVVFVAADNGKVAAMATDTREPIWPLDQGVFATNGRIDANLAADQSGLYIASTDTKLYCLQRASGRVRWQFFAGAPLHIGPTLTKDTVYLIVPGMGLAAIDKNAATQGTRQARWMAANARQFVSEDDKYVYVRTNDNQLAALDKTTGQQQFTSHRPDLVAFGENTKGDGICYVSTRMGRIIAVRPVLQPGEVGELVLAPVTPTAVAVAR